MSEPEIKRSTDNFITEIIDRDIESGKYAQKIQTRFPPEPNGYLHIGHAKSMVLNFTLAERYGGTCNLRFDDTNPLKEEEEYVRSIEEDVRWMGFDLDGRVLYASDYFQTIYEYALKLIRDGKAYVDDLTADEIRQTRGTLTEPGTESPHRVRTVQENLNLFERMKNGEFPNGSRTLRAKGDMKAANLNMRDPVMYRILKSPHNRTGDTWCIYPMYDWAHGQSDSIEGVTHSICTLEFEDHRPLYDWYLDQLGIHHPRQIEFARLNMTYTVLSKRRLSRLVQEGHVQGWDDPRMPTLSGMRRRGYTPEAIRDFCNRIGIAKTNSVVDFALLEHCLREDLNRKALRMMAVLNPVKVVIENYPVDQVEQLTADNNTEDPEAGTRSIPFSRELYIEQDDFMEDAPKKFFRLAPDREVRLKHAYIIKCASVIKNDDGSIREIRCSYDPESKSGGATADRKVKGTLHWVSAAHARTATVRLYDTLLTTQSPDEVKDEEFVRHLNPQSLQELTECKIEPSLAEIMPGTAIQFLRLGYFCLDAKTSTPGMPVFNRTATLRDTWAKLQKQQDQKEGERT